MFQDLKPYVGNGVRRVSWLPSIPTHWRSARLKRITTTVGGATPAKERPEFWTGGSIPWVSPKDMKVDVIGDSIDHVTDLALTESPLQLVPAGSVLMVVRGMILARRARASSTSTKDNPS
jgi:type I restriction enzyme S subunit